MHNIKRSSNNPSALLTKDDDNDSVELVDSYSLFSDDDSNIKEILKGRLSNGKTVYDTLVNLIWTRSKGKINRSI